MTIEVYDSYDGTITVIEEGSEFPPELLSPHSYLLRTINGKDWDDCMRQHHELMGWEPYKPF